MESNNPGVEPALSHREVGAPMPAPSPDQTNVNPEVAPAQPQPVNNPISEPTDEELMKMPQTRDSSYAGIGDFGVDNNYFDQYLNIDKFKKFAPTSTA